MDNKILEIYGPYLTVSEAAEYMRISPRMLRYLISNDEIKRINIGRKVLLRKIDVDRYMESKIAA